MSGLLSGKVWHSGLPSELKPLAASLADIAEHDGTEIFPSVAMMAWLIGVSERTIQYQLKALKECGVLRVVRFAKGGRSKAVEYQLMESELPVRETWQEYKKRTQNLHPLDNVKGAIHDIETPERVQNEVVKGAIHDIKGAIAVAPEPLILTKIEPSYNSNGKLDFRKFKKVFNHEMGGLISTGKYWIGRVEELIAPYPADKVIDRIRYFAKHRKDSYDDSTRKYALKNFLDEFSDLMEMDLEDVKEEEFEFPDLRH